MCSVIAGVALADTVQLGDGSRLVGKVLRLNESVLTLETGFAGTLEIPADQIANLQTDEAVNVQMSSGDRLIGPLTQQMDSSVVQTQMGAIPVKPTEITAIWGPDDQSPEEQAAAAKVAALTPKWSLTGEFGASKQTGNTDRADVHGSIELKRKTEVDLLKLFVQGKYGEIDEDRDAAEIIGGAYYEYSFTPRWYAYGRNTYEYDEFEQLELRVVAAAGAGYYFIKKPEHEFKMRGGIGLRHESYLEDDEGNRADSETDVIGDLGLDYRIDIKPWLQFVQSATYTPSFERLDDYRLESDTGVLIPLGEGDKWKLKIGMRHDYDSQPASRDIERLDSLYYTNVQLNLE